MLEQSEVQALVKKAQEGCQKSKTTLITENSPLIKSVIRRFCNRGVEYDDLYQLGSLGFFKAINNFSPEFGVKFSTYAVPMIMGEVKRFLRDNGAIKVSRATKTLSYKISYFIDDYKSKHFVSPSLEQVATEFEISVQDVVFAMESAKTPLSIFEKTDDNSEQVLLDKIPSKDGLENIDDKILLRDLIKNLNERERKIILLRYYRDKTQSEVAKVLNVSQVQVSRIESKIIAKMRQAFTEDIV